MCWEGGGALFTHGDMGQTFVFFIKTNFEI